MSAASIYVVGAEGSGSTLLWNCIARHPQLQAMKAWDTPGARDALPAEDVILHLSLPTLRPMRWVGGWAAPGGVRVILIRRSPLHAVFSAYRRFYRRPQPAWRNYLRATALEASWVARHDPLCVAYEDLVHNTAKVLRSVYAYLGVEVGFMPAIAITDQNDERWRHDARFAAFMSQALGVDPARDRPADVPVEQLDFGCHGTRIVIADATGAGVAASLRASLPPNLDPPGDATPAVKYVVERHVGARGVAAYRVLWRGEVCLRSRQKGRVVDWLRADIEGVVAGRSRQSLFVHAGVVGWRGRSIVIPGRTMSGKSRLVTELVRCGATYYSDEFAVFDREGRVLPFARRAVLRDAGVEVDPRRDAVAALPVGLIVSTSYRAGVAWQPREVRGARAVLPIIDNTVLARQESRPLLLLSAKLAARAVTLQGPRPEASVVAPLLLAHLDHLLDAGEAPEPRPAGAAIVERAQAVLAVEPPDQILAPSYFRVEGLLDEAEHVRLLAFARSRQADFAASSVIAATGERKIDDQFRRSATVHDLAEIWDLFEPKLRRLLPHVRRELDIAWFRVGEIERQMTVHRAGDFFCRHEDNGRPEVASRRLTCVYYFHDQPRRFSGGELKIFERLVRGASVEVGPGYVSVEPEDNSAVFFSSDTPHEVSPIVQTSTDFSGSRFSITVWFRIGEFPTCLESDLPGPEA